jgi:translation elongation factor EF-4
MLQTISQNNNGISYDSINEPIINGNEQQTIELENPQTLDNLQNITKTENNELINKMNNPDYYIITTLRFIDDIKLENVRIYRLKNNKYMIVYPMANNGYDVFKFLGNIAFNAENPKWSDYELEMRVKDEGVFIKDRKQEVGMLSDNDISEIDKLKILNE